MTCALVVSHYTGLTYNAVLTIHQRGCSLGSSIWGTQKQHQALGQY